MHGGHSGQGGLVSYLSTLPHARSNHCLVLPHIHSLTLRACTLMHFSTHHYRLCNPFPLDHRESAALVIALLKKGAPELSPNGKCPLLTT